MHSYASSWWHCNNLIIKSNVQGACLALTVSLPKLTSSNRLGEINLNKPLMASLYLSLTSSVTSFPVWFQNGGNMKDTHEPPYDKTSKMTVCPAKTLISLGLRPDWSEPLLCAQWVAKGSALLQADSKDAEKSLIRLGGCICHNPAIPLHYLFSGATSKVYKCIHNGTGQPWAVKIINKNVSPLFRFVAKILKCLKGTRQGHKHKLSGLAWENSNQSRSLESNLLKQIKFMLWLILYL